MILFCSLHSIYIFCRRICENCREALLDCKHGLPVDKLPKRRTKFLLDQKDPEEGVIEVMSVTVQPGKNVDGSKKYTTKIQWYLDSKTEEWKYQDDWKANPCTYFCRYDQD